MNQLKIMGAGLLALWLWSGIGLAVGPAPTAAQTIATPTQTVLIEPGAAGMLHTMHGAMAVSPKLKVLDQDGRPITLSQIRYPVEVRLTHEIVRAQDSIVTTIQLIEARR